VDEGVAASARQCAVAAGGWPGEGQGELKESPARNVYGLRVVTLLKVLGTGTALLLGTFMFQSLRKERKSRLTAGSGTGNNE